MGGRELPQIFICGDTGQINLLNGVAALLGSEGFDIVRGPANQLGQVKTYTEQEQHELLGAADVAVFTVRHSCSRTLLEAAPRLRGVCYPTIGVETLDLAAATELGVIVGHGATRGNVVGMAESTLMLILMLLYDVRTNIALLAQGEWRRPRPAARQLEGKTVGIVGFGRIARAITERLAGFGVRILAYSPRVRPEALPPGVAKVELDTVLAESDIICLLAGLTAETRRMIGPAELARMKPDAFLINTGRGELVDEDALYKALRDRRIAGAALDTFTVEPLPSDSPLRGLDNVILTPHTVGHTVEGADEFVPVLAENIRRILAGDLPLHCPNPQAEPAWRARLARLETQTR
jgi:D-3-phosphoglycerate dehydrogenase